MPVNINVAMSNNLFYYLEMTQFKYNIKNIRLSLVLTQEQLAKKLKIARSTIASYETGRRNPSFKIIKRILVICKKHNLNEDIF